MPCRRRARARLFVDIDVRRLRLQQCVQLRERVYRDLVFAAIHLTRKAEHPLFFKVVADQRHMTHVAKLRALSELEALLPLLREAFRDSVR